MQYSIDEQMRLDKARKRVEAIKGFYKHLAIYLIVNFVFFAINAINLEPGESFFSLGNFSMAIFWGMGVAAHAFGVFGTNFLFGNDWQERKIRELMEREEQRKGR